MILAISAKSHVVLEFSKPYSHHLLRKKGADGAWLTLTPDGFREEGEPLEVWGRTYLDSDVAEGVYQYKEKKAEDASAKYELSYWVRCGDTGAVGYTFGNFTAPEGDWGEILTPDDLRYTWGWGIDLRATNGAAYTDGQIRFHIDACLSEMERRLNITIKKKRIACKPDLRGLKPKEDYDEEEDYYTYRRERVQRSGWISTRKRPVIEVSRLDLISRNSKIYSLLPASTVDKTKGVIKFFNKPMRAGQSALAVQQAVYPYGAETLNSQYFYAIDYTAGYPSSDAVPTDLRAAIGKMCAVEMLNIVGDGLLAGFSSSSLSMDGVSESFSSTQSATSAMYGARIKQYSDELKKYIKDNKLKFGHMVLGAL